MPLISGLDILRTANGVIHQLDKDAPIHAAMRTDELLERGDLDGSAVWKWVLLATEPVLREERSPEARVQGAVGGSRRQQARHPPAVQPA